MPIYHLLTKNYFPNDYVKYNFQEIYGPYKPSYFKSLFDKYKDINPKNKNEIIEILNKFHSDSVYSNSIIERKGIFSKETTKFYSQPDMTTNSTILKNFIKSLILTYGVYYFINKRKIIRTQIFDGIGDVTNNTVLVTIFYTYLVYFFYFFAFSTDLKNI